MSSKPTVAAVLSTAAADSFTASVSMNELRHSIEKWRCIKSTPNDFTSLFFLLRFALEEATVGFFLIPLLSARCLRNRPEDIPTAGRRLARAGKISTVSHERRNGKRACACGTACGAIAWGMREGIGEKWGFPRPGRRAPCFFQRGGRGIVHIAPPARAGARLFGGGAD